MDGNGGSYAEPALRALGWQGRYLSVGFAAGMAKVALGPLLFKNADIMGIQPTGDEDRLPGRNLDKIERLFRWCREGLLRRHVSAVFPLEQASLGLRLLADRQAIGRIVLTTSLAG
jgi:NADPH2:quinone reductase